MLLIVNFLFERSDHLQANYRVNKCRAKLFIGWTIRKLFRRHMGISNTYRPKESPSWAFVSELKRKTKELIPKYSNRSYRRVNSHWAMHIDRQTWALVPVKFMQTTSFNSPLVTRVECLKVLP